MLALVQKGRVPMCNFTINTRQAKLAKQTSFFVLLYHYELNTDCTKGYRIMTPSAFRMVPYKRGVHDAI